MYNPEYLVCSYCNIKCTRGRTGAATTAPCARPASRRSAVKRADYEADDIAGDAIIRPRTGTLEVLELCEMWKPRCSLDNASARQELLDVHGGRTPTT